MSRLSIFPVLLLTLTSLAPAATAQVGTGRGGDPLLWYTPGAANVVIPQARSYRVGQQMGIRVEGVRARVAIVEQSATTTLDVTLRNPGPAQQEAELILPVPAGAVLSGFDFKGKAAEPTARVLPKDEASRTYHGLVARVKDPALLEFAGYNLLRTSVFPVPPYGTQIVRVVYETLCPSDGDRVDYLLPRSEAVDQTTPWEIEVSVATKRLLSTVYSPSHALETSRAGANRITATLEHGPTAVPGPFRLSYLVEKGEGVAASLFAFPDPKIGGGYFLLLAGLPADAATDRPPIPREVTLVLDRSGSMNGEKLDQVKTAAGKILEGLRPGEAFNIIVYHQAVDLFSERPVLKNASTMKAALRWIDAVDSTGGTNIHDALVEALRPRPLPGLLPLVLFLTDGLPTVGTTSEVAIRDLAMQHNPWGRRIFTFGVGVDVNTPLLEKIASETRAVATFVLPGESLDEKITRVFKRLSGPLLADTKLRLVDGEGRAAPGRVRDLSPGTPPDLFEGDQLVVAGRYIGDEPLRFELSGNLLGQQKAFRFTFDLDKATTRNGFVPRLWASRQIGTLIDVIRQAGADSPLAPDRARIMNDPKLREIVQEIIRLSTEFGILTEYTAFFAVEGSPLDDPEENARRALENFVERAVKTRSGLDSVNQDVNRFNQANQRVLNPRNTYFDKKMNPVESSSVQQVGDRAFWRKGDRWVEGRLMNKQRGGGQVKPSKIIRFGSEDYVDLVDRLSAEGRQGTVAMEGDILMELDGEEVLIEGPAASH
ncbi:MAG: VIT domain-containing protein [Pseudomonadota bacterium]